MKNTFKKIAATLSAAVMCALPAVNALSANAAASANARYTMRKVYWVDSTAHVRQLGFGFTNTRGGCSPATITGIAPGTLSVGGSAGDVYYNCGGTLTSTSDICNAAVSFSVVCNNPSYYEEGSNVYCRAYKADGTQSYNSVRTVSAFLVGDVNGDGAINSDDHVIVDAASHANLTSYTNTKRVAVTLGGATRYYYAYKLDINDDGKVNSADATMLNDYVSGNLQRFAK